jgi:hypothetical protein
LRKGLDVKMIQSQGETDDLKKTLEKILHDLEATCRYEGNLSIERVVPPPDSSTDVLQGYPSLSVQEERCLKVFGLIPFRKKRTVFFVKEGFYDMDGTGRKDMFVMVNSWGARPIVKKHLQEFGQRHHVTDVIFLP